MDKERVKEDLEDIFYRHDISELDDDAIAQIIDEIVDYFIES
jgi:hypothetical protein